MAKSDPYRLFHVAVKARIALSPSLVRFVLAGDDVAGMATCGPDQRIKLFFPLPGEDAPDPPSGPDWYARYRAMDPARRPPMRTYTISGLRATDREVDVDFVLHGDSGPATRWANRAAPGDRIAVLAPRAGADAGGCEWLPPASARKLLVVADETALPAALGILRTLAERPASTAQVLVEVPSTSDMLEIAPAANTRLHWLPRDGTPHGQRLLATIERLFPARDGTTPAPDDAPPVDIDHETLWQRADDDHGDFYAWIAGEAGVVMAIRRHLVNRRGIDRHQITFMGYWREGRVVE